MKGIGSNFDDFGYGGLSGPRDMVQLYLSHEPMPAKIAGVSLANAWSSPVEVLTNFRAKGIN